LDFLRDVNSIKVFFTLAKELKFTSQQLSTPFWTRTNSGTEY